MQRSFGQRADPLYEIDKFLLLRNISVRHPYVESDQGSATEHELVADHFEINET